MARKIINSTEATNVNNSEINSDYSAPMADQTASESETGASESETKETESESLNQPKKHFYMAHTILDIMHKHGKLSVAQLLSRLEFAGHARIDIKKFKQLVKEIITWHFASFKHGQLHPAFSPEITLENLIKDYNLAWAAAMRQRNGKVLKTITKESKPKKSHIEKLLDIGLEIESELADLCADLAESESESEIVAK